MSDEQTAQIADMPVIDQEKSNKKSRKVRKSQRVTKTTAKPVKKAKTKTRAARPTTKLGKAFGKLIMGHRELLGYSQEKAAYKLKISQSCYSSYEKGYSVPDLTRLYAIGKLFKVNPEELLP